MMFSHRVASCAILLLLSAPPAGVLAAAGDPLIPDVFLLGYNGWADTFTGAPAAGQPPFWGIHLRNSTMMENSDGRAGDGTGADGKFTPYLLVHSTTSPNAYTLSATLSSTDNDGFGLVFGYQNNANYFRVAFRQQASNLGFPQGVSVQKVASGIITQIAGPSVAFVPPINGTPFDVDVIVNGTSWAVHVNGGATPILSGNDASLAAGRCGVMSWGQRAAGGAMWGTELHRIELKDAGGTLFDDTFETPVAWRALDMSNSLGQRIDVLGGPSDLGDLHLDFRTGVIQEDTNAFTWATSTTPNVDFLGTSAVIDEPGSNAFADYELRVRITNFDNDGAGVLVRVEGDDTFYRINFTTQTMGTDGTRAPRGLSVQKVRNGTWSELYRDNQSSPLFVPTPGLPFDLSVRAVGNELTVRVTDNPDGSENVIEYPPLVDATDPLLTGTVGLTSWGNGTQTTPIRYSRYGGAPGPFLVEAAPPCPLHVVSEPEDVRLCPGADAVFAVQVADGEGTLSYRWRRDGVKIPAPEGTAATLTVQNVQTADDNATFACTVTDDCGSVQTRAALLTVRSGPDVVGPNDATVAIGSDAVFAVTATGLGTLSYEWERDSQVLPGQNGSSLALTNLQLADSGSQILCRVTDDCGTTTSRTATLTVGDTPPFTIVVMPDTQNYATSYPQIYDAQCQWIADNKEALNIVMVLHEGDVTNNNSDLEFSRARSSMEILDSAGVPYAIAPGNHDYASNASTRSTLFNDDIYFGPNSPYGTQPTVSGFFEAGKTENTYHTFTAGGRDWLVFAVEFGPRDQVVDWMNQVAAAHPNHYLILVTHAYMYFDDTRYDWATKGSSQSWSPYSYGVASLPGGVNDGQELWDNLVRLHPKWVFTFNGHVLNDGTGYLASLGDNGNVVHQILANYQFRPQGGEGYLRILRFLADGDTVEASTYSPWLDQYLVAPDQQFSLSLTQLPPPPPPIRRVSAANIAVSDGDNVWTVLESGPKPVTTVSPDNEADVSLAADNVPLKRSRGVLMASARQNSRNGSFGTVDVSQVNFFSGLDSDILQVATSRAPNGGEFNVNVATAFFSFDDKWIAGHVLGTGALLESFGVDSQDVTRAATGQYSLSIAGVNSQTDGLLFAIGGENADDIISAAPRTGGDGWDLALRDVTAATFDTFQDGRWSFLYLPMDEPGLVGGRVAADGSLIASAGSFTLTHNEGPGVYRLSVPGATPADGVLLLTVADVEAETGVPAPADNILSYETDGNDFLIVQRDRDGAASPQADGEFVFAFVAFDNTLGVVDVPPDLDDDGDVDADDFDLFDDCALGPAIPLIAGCENRDFDSDNDVDLRDFAVLQRCLSGMNELPDRNCAD